MRSVALYQMLFGIIVLVVGILGFTQTDSYVSLIGGIVIGLDLIFLGLRLQKGWRPALPMSLFVGAMLAGYFGKQWLIDHGGFFPAILMTVLSILSILLICVILVQPTERKRDF